jgi:hypothetical protein
VAAAWFLSCVFVRVLEEPFGLGSGAALAGFLVKASLHKSVGRTLALRRRNGLEFTTYQHAS